MNFLDFIFKKLNPKEAQTKNISLNKKGRDLIVKLYTETENENDITFRKIFHYEISLLEHGLEISKIEETFTYFRLESEEDENKAVRAIASGYFYPGVFIGNQGDNPYIKNKLKELAYENERLKRFHWALYNTEISGILDIELEKKFKDIDDPDNQNIDSIGFLFWNNK
ncbi:hypothetical protein VSDKYIMU_CDS0132 [Enterococcus phage VRE9_4]